MVHDPRAPSALALNLATAAFVLLGWPAYGAAQTITEFPINAPASAITVGPDGALWFFGGGIGRITTSGGLILYQCNPVCGSSAANFGAGVGIAAGPDGALWFADDGAIGRITTSGVITEYTLPSPSSPGGITAGPDGAMWFTDDVGKIGRITKTGSFRI